MITKSLASHIAVQNSDDEEVKQGWSCPNGYCPSEVINTPAARKSHRQRISSRWLLKLRLYVLLDKELGFLFWCLLPASFFVPCWHWYPKARNLIARVTIRFKTLLAIFCDCISTFLLSTSLTDDAHESARVHPDFTRYSLHSNRQYLPLRKLHHRPCQNFDFIWYRLYPPIKWGLPDASWVPGPFWHRKRVCYFMRT